MFRSTISIAVFLILAAFSPGHADMIRWESLEKRVADADLIVLGKITGIESYRASIYDLQKAPDDLHKSAVEGLESMFFSGSRITISPDVFLKGQAGKTQVRFQVVGGRVGPALTPYTSGHNYQLGSPVVVFLERITKDDNRWAISLDRDFKYALSSLNGLFYVNSKDDQILLDPAYSDVISRPDSVKAGAGRETITLEHLRQVVKKSAS